MVISSALVMILGSTGTTGMPLSFLTSFFLIPSFKSTLANFLLLLWHSAGSTKGKKRLTVTFIEYVILPCTGHSAVA